MHSAENPASSASEGSVGAPRRAIPAAAIESHWTARGGLAIRRIDWPAPEPCRGSLLFLPGRGDAYEKYLETLDYWAGRGWRVTASDWRGQAGSGRLGSDPVTGHIDDFGTWVDDLADLWADWRGGGPGPLVLVGHSMGGHLVLRALAERRVDPDAVVLSAPMLGFAGPPLPGGLLQGAARLMNRLGNPARPAWKWSEKPGQLPAGRAALLTHDPGRYADEGWWRERRPELVMGPSSWGWVERAYASMALLDAPGVLEAIDTPVFLFGTTSDRLVGYKAIARAAERLPHAQLLTFGPEAAHEILRESDPLRDKALAAIDTFLEREAPPAR